MLTYEYVTGVRRVFSKFALDAPTLADQFPEAVEAAKDIPPETTMAGPMTPVPPPLPHTGLSHYLEEEANPKAAGLGLQQMLELEGLLGPGGFKEIQHSIASQMAAKGGGVSKRLNISPTGVRAPDTIISRRPIPPPPVPR